MPRQTIKAGTTATEPAAPTFEGYTFEGWFINGAAEPFNFSTPIDKNIKLYADWAQVTD